MTAVAPPFPLLLAVVDLCDDEGRQATAPDLLLRGVAGAYHGVGEPGPGLLVAFDFARPAKGEKRIRIDIHPLYPEAGRGDLKDRLLGAFKPLLERFLQAPAVGLKLPDAVEIVPAVPGDGDKVGFGTSRHETSPSCDSTPAMVGPAAGRVSIDAGPAATAPDTERAPA